MRVQIHLRAEKLKNIARGKWRGKRSSPYCRVVSHKNNGSGGGGGGGELVGTTEVQQEELNPNFATSIIVNHDESVGWTQLRITIRDCRRSSARTKANDNEEESQRTAVGHRQYYHRPLHHLAGLTTILDYGNNHNYNDNNDDEDLRNDATDPKMGQVDIEIGEILTCQGQEKEIDLIEGGKLFVHITTSIQGTSNSGVFHCQIRGLDCINFESGLLGLGAVDPYYIIRKKYNDIQSGITRWYVVYQSEYIHDIINPYWKPFTLDLERLCNNDWKKPLKIAIYDHEMNGTDRWVGEVDTSVEELISSVAKCGNADRQNALRVVAVDEEDGKEDLRALLVILKADVIRSAG